MKQIWAKDHLLGWHERYMNIYEPLLHMYLLVNHWPGSRQANGWVSEPRRIHSILYLFITFFKFWLLLLLFIIGIHTYYLSTFLLV